MRTRVLFPFIAAMFACGKGGDGLARHPLGETDSVVFLVQSVSPSGMPTMEVTTFWNGAEHLDTVRLTVLHRNEVEVDSLRVRVRAGPMVSLDSSSPELPAPDRIDSLGRWFEVPRDLFEVSAESAPTFGVTILRLHPESIDRWVGDVHRDRPYTTRLSVEVWSGGRHLTRELAIQLPV